MINTQDQEELFRLISNFLDEDLDCVAIGGTAMMFLGYKNTTKDIDLVFEDKKKLEVFISAISKLGYVEMSLNNVYDERRRKQKGKPRVFTRGSERFDLFVSSVFGFNLNIKKELFTHRFDFLGKKEFVVKVLPKEFLVLLKAITGRDRDQEDMETIITKEKSIDWDVIVNAAIEQRKHNQWLLYDLESSMKELKKKTFIKQKYFQMIYSAEKKAV